MRPGRLSQMMVSLFWQTMPNGFHHLRNQLNAVFLHYHAQKGRRHHRLLHDHRRLHRPYCLPVWGASCVGAQGIAAV